MEGIDIETKEFDSYSSKEIMINVNGRPMFAVCISSEGNNANYVYCKGGDIQFASSWCSGIQPFSLGNESHAIAKEIFTVSIRATIQNKILELKQLQSILCDLHLEDCIGTLIQDNTKLLLEVKSAVEQNAATRKTELREAVVDAVVDTVHPMAVKKEKRKPKGVLDCDGQVPRPTPGLSTGEKE